MSRLGSASLRSVFRGGPAVALSCLVLAGLPLAACASVGPNRSAEAPEQATEPAVDLYNRTYTLTCDGIVPSGFPATVVDGVARVPADASRPPHYDHYDIRVTGTATGDVDGDGAPDNAVLLDCSPQPSNGVVQEVLLFSSTGRPLGALQSPLTLQGQAPLPPVYDPGGLSIQDGEIVAAMTAYGPNDFHASGPSIPIVVRWRFDGHDFLLISS